MAKRTNKNRQFLTDIYNALYRHFGPQHWWPGDSPFEIAVGAILTQNTNWGNVEKAIQNVRREQCLYAKKLHEMPHAKLASLIKPAGYFNVKAKRLRNFLSFLLNHYKGSMKRMDASDTALLRESLLNVNGIGPETADSILLYALGRPIFVIDAYTKRVLHRHGIVADDVTYHEMQELFHDNLPDDVQLFNEYHALFVMVGKHYCRPRARCEGCPLEALLL
jgi:endonuclease-3 related protein